MRLRNLLVWGIVIWPAAARAGGYYASDIGAVAGARGGAFVARADDLTAVWYNPAGLADGSHGWRLHLDVAGFFSKGDYTRDCAGTGGCGPNAPTTQFPTISNGADPLVIPTLVVAHDLGPRGAIALSLLAPYGPAYSYPTGPTAPQRYSLVDNSPFIVYYTLSGAYRITDRISVGASFEWVDFKFDQRLVASVYCPGNWGDNPEDPKSDVLIKLDGTDHFEPAGNVGVHARVTDSIEVGASYQLPFATHNEGHLETPGLAGFNAAQPANRQLSLNPNPAPAQVEIDLPMVARAGVRFVQPRWDAELDVVYEGWHANDHWTVKIPNTHILSSQLGSTPVPDLEIPKNFNDCVSIRLGGDRLTWGDADGDHLVLRGGVFYETSAVPTNRIDVSQVDGPKLGLSVGGSYRTGRFDISLGFTHVQVFEVNASDNQNFEINAFAPMLASRADLIAKGKYTAHYEIIALGLRTYFGR